MRRVFLVLAAFLAVIALVLRSGGGAAAADSAERLDSDLFRIIFGAHRLIPGETRAIVSSSQEGVEAVRPWLSAEVEPQGGGRWIVTLDVPAQKPPGANVNIPQGVRPKPIPGFLIEVSKGFGGQIDIDTDHGAASFRSAEVTHEQAAVLLDGFIHVERAPRAKPLASTEADEDYPSIAAAADGGIWAVWVSFVGNGERLLLSKVGEDGWRQPRQVNEGLSEIFRPQVAVDGEGRVWVVWSEMRSENWDLYSRAWDNGRWSDIVRLTDDPGPDTNPALATDPQGAVWMVWQGYHNSRASDIFLKMLRHRKWSAEPVAIDPHPASDWEPALAIGPQGRVYVAWSSYRHGSHDIFLAELQDGAVASTRRLSGGNRLHARPSLAVDRQGSLWITWEEGAADWGKDTVQTNGGLHRERRVKIYRVDGDRLQEPAQRFEDAQTLWTGDVTEHARLQVDARGRLWAFYRITFLNRFWQQAALVYDGSRWSEPLIFEDSLGRQAAYVSTAVSGDGTLWLAYPGDDRTQQAPFVATQNDVYLSSIPNGKGAASPVRLRSGRSVEIPPAHDRPYSRTWPEREIRIANKTYRLVWGELHKHTDINHHGRPDGSLEDAYRYARDSADLDFFATTDHIRPGEKMGVNPMTWWRSQKYADLNRIPGVFEPLYAYESSKRGPQGHRNIVFPRRGGVLFGGIEGPTVNDPRPLWEALRQNPSPSMAIPHQLTDSEVSWDIYDPAFTPIMELYQPRRQNYEYDGAPQPPGVEQRWGKKAGSWAWDALAKDRKVGFIASTDHMSSHTGYAAAFVEDLSREGVFRALQQRHTYASSENIILDFRLVGPGGREHLMGDEVEIDGLPQFRIEAIGVKPIEVVEIVRDGKFVFRKEPGERRVELRFTDNEPLAGEAYYYVRVRQEDGHLAWSSPIWVRR